MQQTHAVHDGHQDVLPVQHTAPQAVAALKQDVCSYQPHLPTRSGFLQRRVRVHKQELGTEQSHQTVH